jgi:hypothetical protein
VSNPIQASQIDERPQQQSAVTSNATPSATSPTISDRRSQCRAPPAYRAIRSRRAPPMSSRDACSAGTSPDHARDERDRRGDGGAAVDGALPVVEDTPSAVFNASIAA